MTIVHRVSTPKRVLQHTALLASIFFLTSCGRDVRSSFTADPDATFNKCGDSVTDLDGNAYATVTIGDDCWMSVNLSTSKYRNGEPIRQIENASQWSFIKEGAWTYYENDEDHDVFGRMYNWLAVQDPRGICPTGWRVPSDEDWSDLQGELGVNAGLRLMKTDKSLFKKTMDHLAKIPYAEEWFGLEREEPLGFDALAGGYRASDGSFYNIEKNTFFWSSTPDGDASAISRNLYMNHSGLDRNINDIRSGFYIRCMKG